MLKKAEEKRHTPFFSFPEALEELPVNTNVFPTGPIVGPSIQLSDDNRHEVYVDYWTEEVLD